MGGFLALSNPPLVPPLGHPDAAYIQDEARLLGIRTGDGYVAIPHNILFRHEVVNLDVDGIGLAVTYCPLTGSFVAFWFAWAAFHPETVVWRPSLGS